MKFKLLTAFCCIALLCAPHLKAQSVIPKRSLQMQKLTGTVKVDGLLTEACWKTAAVADHFTLLRPTPFQPEPAVNASEVYFLYSNEGLYVGGYFHEGSKDSISSELAGRDGMGNNDFVGLVFDTYNDKINGFEYFVTPLGEQWDAKTTSGNEDFSWNAVWESAAVTHADGWSFEFFIPYSAIRFGKKNMQEWGLNIVRKREKSGQQLFWQSIDPNINGFLTQSGLLTGLEGITPPLRLQFSPYFSSYLNHDGTAGSKQNSATINGGMDVKYGINQAFTLDMTLIPDFGQVQTDNRVLNLSPFEQKFTENRSFFTEGTELFNKGDLFYSRRIGVQPVYSKDLAVNAQDSITDYPQQARIVNATKISGRTQHGLGIGMLNAITQPQYAVVRDRITGETRKLQNMPLTNYNILVLDQTLKHNSSVSLVNTNVLRSGSAYDANVSSALFNFNDRKNTWNVGGNVSVSNISGGSTKTVTGYAHSVYFGKVSGHLNFNVFQNLYTDKYDKSDLGYITNNNFMEQGFWVGYTWNKPHDWYNNVSLNVNFYNSRLVTPIDVLKRRGMMFQSTGYNINGNAQTKKLWSLGFNTNLNSNYNDFYEARYYGRVFRNTGSHNLRLWLQSNGSKKLSFYSEVYGFAGGQFHSRSGEFSIDVKYRFSKKFSVEHTVDISDAKNQVGWAAITGAANDEIIFARRNQRTVENVLDLKYSFTNRMGFTLRARHYWSRLTPVQFYDLDIYGDLQTPATPFTGDVRQNYNFMSVDMVYSWQFAQGSFLNVVWKDIGDNPDNRFEHSYIKNLGNTLRDKQFNSLSVRVIYFIDYLTAKRRLSRKS